MIFEKSGTEKRSVFTGNPSECKLMYQVLRLDVVNVQRLVFNLTLSMHHLPPSALLSADTQSSLVNV